jgi:CspA family cold shock protein
MQGTVKFYRDMDGYGFIKGDDSSDIFFHIRNTEPRLEKLTKGQRVSYEQKSGDRGLFAVNIIVI